MRLAKLSEYRRMIYAEGSAPSLNTLRSLIDRNMIPGGEKRHGRYFVDLDTNDQASSLRADIAKRQTAIAQDPLMAGLI